LTRKEKPVAELLQPRSLAEIMAETHVTVEKSARACEHSYRRGCHQTAAQCYEMVKGCRNIRHALSLLAAFENTLGEFRYDLSTGNTTLLWDAAKLARRR